MKLKTSYSRGFTPSPTLNFISSSKPTPKKLVRGFTLLEILLVVGIIAILAGIVIVAINPARQLAQVRNTERKSDIKQIKSAIEQYYIDTGHYPTSTPTTLTEICDTGSLPYPATDASCDNLFNLSILVPTYITAIPTDPQATASTTGYSFMKDATNKIVITAPEAEIDQFIAIGTSTATTSTPGASMPSGLIAHYKMNDNTSSATVLDALGNYNGTAQRNTSLMSTTSGQIGRALSFNGSSDYITNTSLNLGAPFSWTLWFRCTANSGNKTLIRQTGDVPGTDNAMVVNWTDLDGGLSDKLVAGFASPGWSWLVSTASVNDGAWHHGAVTYDGSIVQLYVDGVNEASSEMTVNAGSGPLWIGRYFGSAVEYMDGNIDDIRIYNTALTGPAEGNDCTDEPETDICKIYNDGAGTEAE